MQYTGPKLDERKIKKATVSQSVQSPVSVYPSSVGVLAGVYMAAFGLNPIALGVCAGGLVVGCGGWIYEYFVKGEKHALKYMKKYREELSRQRHRSLHKLQSELEDISHDAGLRQLSQLVAKFENFERVLAKKLDPSELTYSRYLVIAEQVFLSALDNLEQLAFGLRSVQAIDIHLIQNQLRDLNDDSPKRAPLMERAHLWQDQQDKAKKWLLDNEFAMTQLDVVSTRLAGIRTREAKASMDMEDAMSELQHLIDRADKYDIRR